MKGIAVFDFALGIVLLLLCGPGVWGDGGGPKSVGSVNDVVGRAALIVAVLALLTAGCLLSARLLKHARAFQGSAALALLMCACCFCWSLRNDDLDGPVRFAEMLGMYLFDCLAVITSMLALLVHRKTL